MITRGRIPGCADTICRVFAKLGEKKNRAAARMKFLVAKLGIQEFKRLVMEERAALAPDELWTSYLEHLAAGAEQPLKVPRLLQISVAAPEGFAEWRATNVYSQRQSGYATVTIALSLGDITGHQLRALADIARTYVRETVRSTVEQNLVLRWVSEGERPSD